MPDEAIRKDEIVRADILQAARELFQRFGLAKTTMEEIAKASGKGKSTLYYYYTSKEEIFSATLQEDIQDTLRQVNAAVARAETAEAKLMAFTVTRIRIIAHKVNLYGSLYRELADNPGPVNKIRKSFEAPVKNILRNILILGIDNGEFKLSAKNDLELMTQALFSTLRGVETSVFEDNKSEKTGNRLVEIVMNLICNGLKTA